MLFSDFILSENRANYIQIKIGCSCQNERFICVSRLRADPLQRWQVGVSWEGEPKKARGQRQGSNSSNPSHLLLILRQYWLHL